MTLDAAKCMQFLRMLAGGRPHDLPRHGISEAAFHTISEFVGRAQHADPNIFRRPADGGDADARRTLRFLCALIPETVPDDQLPDTLLAIVSNPHLSRADVAAAIDGTYREVPGAVLRKAGAALRSGHPAAQVARVHGIHRNTVMQLAAFLDVYRARVEHNRDLAADIAEAGGTWQQFRERSGMPVRQARELFEDVAEGVEVLAG